MKCSKLEQYEEMQRKHMGNTPPAPEKKIPEIISELDEHINSMNGRGNYLPDSMSSFLEPRFGYDFQPSTRS